MRSIMYKFYAAYLTNELISSQIRFFDKKKEVEENWGKFESTYQSRSKTGSKKKENMIKMQAFCEFLRIHFGYFEGDRFRNFMQKGYPGEFKFTIDILTSELAAMYERDMRILLSECFERLQFGDDVIDFEHLMHGFAVNMSTHTDDFRK